MVVRDESEELDDIFNHIFNIKFRATEFQKALLIVLPHLEKFYQYKSIAAEGGFRTANLQA